LPNMRSKFVKVNIFILGHDLNEKKQHEVGRLNKIHDTLKNSTSDTVLFIFLGERTFRKHKIAFEN
jgi:hypothetical protein